MLFPTDMEGNSTTNNMQSLVMLTALTVSTESHPLVQSPSLRQLLTAVDTVDCCCCCLFPLRDDRLYGVERFSESLLEVVLGFESEGEAKEVAMNAHTLSPIQLSVVSEESVRAEEGEVVAQRWPFTDPNCIIERSRSHVSMTENERE